MIESLLESKYWPFQWLLLPSHGHDNTPGTRIWRSPQKMWKITDSKPSRAIWSHPRASGPSSSISLAESCHDFARQPLWQSNLQHMGILVQHSQARSWTSKNCDTLRQTHGKSASLVGKSTMAIFNNYGSWGQFTPNPWVIWSFYRKVALEGDCNQLGSLWNSATGKSGPSHLCLPLRLTIFWITKRGPVGCPTS